MLLLVINTMLWEIIYYRLDFYPSERMNCERYKDFANLSFCETRETMEEENEEEEDRPGGDD